VRRRPWLALALSSALLCVLACASPTLPLPPPSPPVVSPEANGMVHLASTSGAEPNAIIVIYNANPNVPLDKRVGGAQADANGSWDADVFATHGDLLEISQQFGKSSSAPTDVQVP
jgi:hypothetical protein